MAIQLSPGTVYSEIDNTTVVPAVSTSSGAFVGDFAWGPANVVTQVSNEDNLVKGFGKPTSSNYISFFSAANFLAYSNNLKLVRVIGTNGFNATSSGIGVPIQNETIYEIDFGIGTQYSYGAFYARYAGELGNSIKVSLCSSKLAFSDTTTITTSLNSNVVTFENYLDVTDHVSVGDNIIIGGTTFEISAVQGATANVSVISSNGSLSDKMFDADATGVTATTKWKYAGYFDSAPTTSLYGERVGGYDDELHVIVLDADGKFPQSGGIKNAVLETYAHVSKASDAKTDDGLNNYYVNKIFSDSLYIYVSEWLDESWGKPAAGTVFAGKANHYSHLSGAYNPAITEGDIISGWHLFDNSEEVDVSLLISGEPNAAISNKVIDLASTRKDCISFVSPLKELVTGTVNVANVIAYRNTQINRNTSYAVMDSAWKYQYDKYNNTYRYIPLNADIAGLCAKTDNDRDAWWSPAGFNRGQIRNAIKLSWNPSQADRDELYKAGINPVVSFPGQGIVLYGDKTMQGKSSAFDRINVRRLFIVLEKTISNAAKYSLFEFNDDFTRAQFVNLVEPFLRDVQGRKGIYAYRVVCDTTNNTPQVVDSNRFVGDIYIKPSRSINFIQLNFVAVNTGVSFNEIAGSTGAS